VNHTGEKNSQCPPSLRRKVRSFVKRQGRTSKRQTNALDRLFPKFGVKISGNPLDLASLFGREAVTILEIGFGMGDTLAQMAINNPEKNYIGIEVHTPGIGSLLATIDENNINNIRIFSHDAVEVLQQSIKDDSLDKVQIFFPDPWPKKRHHKRRLIQPLFVALIAAKLKPKGILHIATDWENYAQWIEEILSASTDFIRLPDDIQNDRPPTKFEQRGRNLGHGVWDMVYSRKP